jgi:5-methylcytosine-specific restriction endonuclease McrA
MEGRRVLVLNNHFHAVALTGWQRAIALILLERALAVDGSWRTYDFSRWLDFSASCDGWSGGFARTPRLRVALPEVILLRAYGGVPRREAVFNRRNLYLHYAHRCCYCGEECSPEDLTLDHVLPRSRGGKSGWENVVVSCTECNKRKGDRLPSEAQMTLRVVPAKPKAQTLGGALNGSVREAWLPFLNGGPSA